MAGQPNGERWAKIPSGFPAVVVADDRVLVYPMDGRVFILALANGEVIADFRPALAGLRLTTERLIYSMSAEGLGEFDHRAMQIVHRTNYWQDVAPLYRGREPTVTGYTLTAESVLWAASHGALMAVSRRPGSDGRYATWVDEIPGGIMPLAQAPVVSGDHLYFVDLSKLQVICYESTAT